MGFPMTPRTPEQREAARQLAEKWLAQHAAQYPNAHPDDPCSICTLSRALLDAEAEVAAMKAVLAEITHARGCKSNECRACRMSIWNHFTDARWCSCSPTHTVFSPFACDCHLAILSDSIARGRELLEKEAELAKLKGDE